MPVELRERLQAAASRSGRSLNRELVHRLEQSLEAEDRRVSRTRERVLRLRPRAPREGSSMSRRTRHVLAAVGLVVAAVAAIAAAIAIPGSSTQARTAGDGEFAGAALGQHLAELRQAVPGNAGMAEEGPASAADAAFTARAYPDSTISMADAAAARASWATQQGRPFPRGKGRPGTRVTVGPSQALYPDTPFRNAFNYVPNAYVAGGRTTAIAIADTCKPGDCKLYVTPAGGGIWRTKNALTGQPHWEFLGGPLGINAAGAVTIDPNDPSGNTIYVGTGEANVCGSGCVAGTGLYKSTDGGDTWTGPLGGPATDSGNPLGGKGIGAIVVEPGSPDTLYVGTTTALRGMSSTCCTGVTRPIPGAAKWGLYKSTDGGASWSFIHNGSASAADCTGSLTEFNNGSTCSPRGVRHVKLDPSNSDIVYAGSYARGIWRSPDGGATWTQIKPSLNAAVLTTRPSFDVTTLPSGATRMYVYEGNTGNPYSRLFRSDSVATGVP
ncbi:MAG TPA: Arc family DNA-binding protein, partial [Gaiellaceae bacterium]|nr:Arc family DNA-binding protein [Gaiellaceae bacterium]